MIEIICLFFPALFSTFALERLLKKKLSLRNFLMVFVTNTIFANLVGLFSMYCMSKYVLPFSTANGVSVKHSFAYIAITFVVSIIMALVESFYFYRLRIGVIDNKNTTANTNNDN